MSGIRKDRYVSIHAPREGCDPTLVVTLTSPSPFQFTHPGRGATATSPWSTRPTPSFNSRTPGGVRLLIKEQIEAEQGFQFTHPGRGATVLADEVVAHTSVSIHAPREGCDNSDSLHERVYIEVSIHAPREGCDL